MTDVQSEGELSGVWGRPPTEDSMYHYSPVASNCMACITRATSRKRKELEAQKSDIICGPCSNSEDICNSSNALASEKYHRARLHVVTTNQRIRVFGKWSKQKLLAMVTDRLLQRAISAPLCSYEKIPPPEIKPISAGIPYDPIIHRGLYSESILRRLYCSGASESVVIRAMKFGLRHLKLEDLNYFEQFGVSIPVLKSRELWKDSIDDALILSLRTMGFNEKSSRKIMLTGMLAQSEIYLMQMMLAGVDVPCILNWQGPTIEVGVRMTKFLRKLGVTEDMLQLVVQKGVDEETNEMLKDLGYTETEEEEHIGMHEVVVCECDLTILESRASPLVPRTCNIKSSKTLVSNFDDGQEDLETGETCACLPNWSNSMRLSLKSSDQSLVTCENKTSIQNSLTSSEFLIERIQYLRRTVMAPLAWAMAGALRYRPSDPIHYIACQLVRWRHGGVCDSEMKETEDLVIARTIAMDKKLMEQKQKDEQELMNKREKEILQNIPCHPCWERQQIHRVKERCWKCIKKWVPNYEPCELLEICSSCKVDLSAIIPSHSSTTSTGNISSALDVDQVIPENRESFDSLYQYSEAENMDSSSCYRNYMCEESFPSSSHDKNITESTSRVSNDLINSENIGEI